MSDLSAWRLVAGRALGLGDLPPEPVHPASINAMLKRAAQALTEMGGVEVGAADLDRYFEIYVDSVDWSHADPPWPLKGFCAPGTLQALVREYDRRLEAGLYA